MARGVAPSYGTGTAAPRTASATPPPTLAGRAPVTVSSAAMPSYAFEGRTPQVHPDAWVAPTATLVGEVIVEAGASIWYGAVLRADFSAIIVRAGANVQDNSVLHGGCEVGVGATVGHICVIHSATLGEECLIGNGATVLDGAIIGARSLVAAHSLVSPGTEIPEGVLAAGSPAVVKRSLDGPAAGWVARNPSSYQELARRHAASLRLVEDEDGAAS